MSTKHLNIAEPFHRTEPLLSIIMKIPMHLTSHVKLYTVLALHVMLRGVWSARPVCEDFVARPQATIKEKGYKPSPP